MRRRDTLFLVLALLPLSGCLQRSRPLVLHTLRPLSRVEAGQPAAQAFTLEVMPVQIPDLLQRPQVVSVQGPERLGLSEIHHWGNPLEKEIQRVLVENLGALLGSDGVVAYPLGERVRAGHRLTLEIQSLEGQPGGQLQLQAVWILARSEAGPAILFRRVHLQEPVTGSDTDALVAAHGRVLAALSREIAGELRKLSLISDPVLGQK